MVETYILDKMATTKGEIKLTMTANNAISCRLKLFLQVGYDDTWASWVVQR